MITRPFDQYGTHPVEPSRMARWLSVQSWTGRLLALLFLMVPMWYLDKPIALWNPRGFNLHVLGDLRDSAQQFGEPFGVAWVGMALWFSDKVKRRPLVMMMLAVVVAGGVGSGLKLVIGRVRPQACRGETVFRPLQRPGEYKPDPSFPSGHTTTAFAFAYGLSRLYPSARKVFLFLAVACGVSRALGQTHFVTDVLCGAWVGWEVAGLVWGWGFGGLIRWIDARIPDISWYPKWDWDATGFKQLA